MNKFLDEKDSSLLLDDDKVYDIWPIPDQLKSTDTSSVGVEHTTEFQFAIHEQLV